LGHHTLTPFVHALFGVSTFHFNAPAFGGSPAFSESDNAFSFAFGGGLDWKVTRHIAIRLAQVDYQQTRLLHTIAVQSLVSPDNQNNFKYSGGIVIRFGEK
jgi:opacity protein-like surface antigen